MARAVFRTIGNGVRSRRLPLTLGLSLILSFFFFFTHSFALIDLTIFGPKRYDRLKGKPTVYIDTFERCNPSSQALIKVTNGDGKKTRIKSARIYVNGTKVASEKDFKQKVPSFEKLITVQEHNELKIILKSGRHGYLDKLAKYQSKKAELEQELARLQELRKGLSSETSALSTAKIEGLLKEVHEIKKSLDEHESSLSGMSRGLDDDSEDEAEPESDDEDEIDSGWVVKEREKLDKYREEIKNTVKETGKAQGALDRTPKNKRDKDHDKKDEALKELAKLLKELDRAIEKVLDRLEDIEEKIEKIKKKGPSFLIIEVIGKGCDDTPPVVSSPEPADGSLLNTGAPKISASYADDPGGSGIDTATARITVDGKDVTSDASVAPTGISYLPRSNLPEGGHTVTVSVSDRARNAASLTWGFTTDTIAPVVAVTSHQNDRYQNTSSITLSGSIDDPTATVTVNGQQAQVSGNSFSYAGLSLTEGPNAITVSATDPAGNTGTATITINLDTQAPVITISTPVNNVFVNTSSITVAGSINEPITSLTINGTAVTPTASNTFSLAALLLIEGENTIAVAATDRAGNSGATSVIVNLDTVLPVPSITSPAANAYVNTPTITVAGTANEPIIEASVNGVGARHALPLQFDADIALAEGPNDITATVTDRAGNPGTASITVNLDTVAPVVQITSHQTGQLLNTPKVTIAGTVSETVTSVTVNGTAATVNQDNTWSLVDLPLVEGENTITVNAPDRAGNTGTATITLVLDTVLPVITVTTPVHNSYVNTPKITLSGTVTEANPDGFWVNDEEKQLTNGSFSIPDFSLTQGINVIRFKAKDKAGNESTASVFVTLDTTAPTVTITAPVNGSITNQSTTTISGAVNEAVTSVKINGQSAQVSGTGFILTNFTLAEGDNTITAEAVDRAGNTGSATTQVTLDTQVPAVTVSALGQAAAGQAITITAGATENRGLTLIEVTANGTPVWTSTLNSDLSTSNSFSYTISPDTALNSVVTLQARAYDTAGNTGSASAQVQITSGPTGAGYIQGEVYDDSKGLRLEAAKVTLNSVSSGTSVAEIVTQPDGGYFTEAGAGNYLVTLAKTGYTTVERIVTVRSEKNAVATDARLTPVSTAQNLIDSNGGKISSPVSVSSVTSVANTIELDVPAGALTEQVDIRLTPISNQGLAGLLPAGWSPVAVVDIRSFATEGTEITEGTSFGSQGAAIKAPIQSSPGTAQSSVNLVRYDKTSHQWIVQNPGTVSADSQFISASLSSTGQFAFVLLDQELAAAPAVGQPLPSVSSVTSVADGITATGRVVPPAAPPSAGLKAVGEVVLSPSETSVPSVANLVSGLLVTARVTERFDLFSGEVVLPSEYIQDLVLYHHPCITNSGSSSVSSVANGSVLTTFPVTPSKEYTITELMLGKVGIEVNLRPEEAVSGTMVGSDGARLLDSDGNVLVIPQNALSQTVPVETKTVEPSTLTGIVGTDFTLLRAVDVNLTNRTLASSAELSIPAPAGLNSALPLVAAKAIEVRGAKRLKLVALARLSGSLITSYPFSVTSVSSVAKGIDSSGTYFFLQAKAPLGFITGTVKDGSDNPYASALTTSSTCSLVDLTAADGKYLIAGTVSEFTAQASDIYKNDTGTATGTITSANGAITTNLVIQVTPPRVVSITPTDNATGIETNASIVITFSEAVDKTTVTSANIVLKDADNKVLEGVFSVNPEGTVVTLYPSALLASETRHTVTISRSIRDLQGYLMGTDVTSTFTVKDTTPPPMPQAGMITGSFPDAEGYVTITATQGSAEATGTVLIINDTSGEIVSVTPNSNGSFTGRIMAMLGDEIKIVLMDPAGNQTLVSYITFKSSDGKYLVTAKGGTVEGEGGLRLDIPEGALLGPTVVKITPVAEDQLPQDNPVPSGAKFLSAVRIDSGGATFLKAVQISVPAPLNIPADAVPFVARPTEYIDVDSKTEKVYEVIDSAKVAAGRLSSACQPFDGILAGETYVFAYPEVQPVIMSGRLYRDINQNTMFDEGTDLPISGALIRNASAMNYVARTNSKGFYATYSWAISNTGTCRDYKIIAFDIYSQSTQNTAGSLCDAPFTAQKDFIFPTSESPFYDKLPPVIEIDLGPKEGFTSGITPVGTNAIITVRVSDNVGVNTANTTMEIKLPDNTVTYDVPLQLSSTTTETVNNTVRLVLIYKATYQPQTPGPYTVTVNARDMAQPTPNSGNRGVTFSAASPSEIPEGIPGPPRVIDGGVYPTPDEEGVIVTTQISVPFTEPVNNVDTTTFKVKAIQSLISDPTFSAGPVAGIVTSYYVGGRMRATFTPTENLRYSTRYEIRLSSAIVDADEGNALPEFVSYFETKVPDPYGLADGWFAGRDIALLGDYAYVAGGETGWRVISVVDPTQPTIKYSENHTINGTTWEYRGVAVTEGVTASSNSFGTGPLAVLTENITYDDGNQYSYIRLYDISDPFSPKVVGKGQIGEKFTGIPGRLAILDKYAYVCSAGFGLQVVDLQKATEWHQPGTAVVGSLETMETYRSPADIAVLKGRIYLTTTAGYFLAVSVNYPAYYTLPRIIGEEAPLADFYASRVAVAGDFSYLDPITGVIQTIDIAVVSSRTGAIFIINITDPTDPKIISSVGGVGATDISINAITGMIYASTWNGVAVIDIKNPLNPQVLVNLGNMGTNSSVVEKNGWIYTADRDKGINVVDLGREAYLIPDYDHNGVIDDTDKKKAQSGSTYYYWINDDDDSGETGGDDIPENIFHYDSGNYTVDGVRDLIDFFPVQLNIKSLLAVYDPSTFIYKLKSPSENMNFLLTDITTAHSNYYLTGDETSLKPAIDTENPEKSLGSATVSMITSSGIILNNHPGGSSFLQQIKEQNIPGQVKGVILLEGSKAAHSPLVLDIYNKNTNIRVLSTGLTINLASVEKMFRHKNLIQAIPGAPALGGSGGKPDRLGELPDFPDEPNAKNFVFVHGYNVNGNEARGWQSEMFKRMYWAGSKAKFWAVSWYGFDTQQLALGLLTPNYHINVQHALSLDTTLTFKNFLESQVKGDITIAAHSLGSMLVSETLYHWRNIWSSNNSSSDSNLAHIKSFFLLDAAIAIEAFGPVANNPNMVHPDWNDYQSFLWATEWNARFDASDRRSKLTWRSRFAERPSGVNYFNFYSQGEDILAVHEAANYPSVPDIATSGLGRYAWALQEKLKGRITGVPVVLGSSYGGWGFNVAQYPRNSVFPELPMVASEANRLDPAALRTAPFFKRGSDDTNLFEEQSGSNHAMLNRNRLLAEAFPALTLAAGREKVPTLQDNNFDMQLIFKTRKNNVIQWPRSTEDWYHGDVKSVGFLYVYKLYDEFVAKGGLKQ